MTNLEKFNQKTIVQFEDLTLEVIPNQEHEWLLSTELVAKGYDVSSDAVLKHRQRKRDELIEGKHFVKEVDNLSSHPDQIFWTKRGVIRLGFSMRGERAIKFRDWAEDLIIEKIEQKPLSQLEILVQSAQILLEQDKRLQVVENKVDTLIADREQATKQVLEIERSTESLPEETTRAKINRLVRTYATARNISFDTVWRLLYDKMFYTYHVNLKARRKYSENTLDCAERIGVIDKLYIVASNVLV